MGLAFDLRMGGGVERKGRTYSAVRFVGVFTSAAALGAGEMGGGAGCEGGGGGREVPFSEGVVVVVGVEEGESVFGGDERDLKGASEGVGYGDVVHC